MEFRAHLFAQRYFGQFLMALFLFMESMFIISKSYVGAAIFAGFAVGALIKLQNRKMSFDPNNFQYDGWLQSFTVPYREIRKVEHSSKTGYPRDRLYGPCEYRITMKSGKRWVNLIWFTPEANRIFHERIIKRHEAHQSPN